MSWEKWNKAISLQNAPLKFGDEAQAAAYRKYHQEQNGMMMLEKLISNIEGDAKGADIFEGLAVKTTSKLEILTSLRNDTKKRLLSGELTGYGFQSPRNVQDAPVQIPSDLWNGRINWERDSLTSGSIKLESLRIEELVSVEIAPAGRPSRQEQIKEAFLTLADQGKIDFSKPKTACYETVRKWVLDHYPDEENGDKGLSVKALEKHVNPLFDQEK
ncbi:MAG: hypothetical protein ABJN40_10745 [Sneathiella sp.]